jgi:3-(3-hydroxy-phenyl)propionate hydroxylase
MSQFTTDVIIAGAGPAGAVAALHLGRAGVRVTLLEAGPTVATDLRASTFHPPTLEYLRDLGLTGELHATGLKAPRYAYVNRRAGTRIVFDMSELADITDFPYRLQCEQWKLTRHAAALLADIPSADIRYSRRVLAYDQDADGVTVHLETPAAIEHVRARYLVGCDGANSVIRKWMGVAFDGFTWEEKFLTLSTQEPVERELGDICHVNYMADPEEWMVLLRAPSAWRVLVPATEATSDADLLSDARKDAVFKRLLGHGRCVATSHRTIYRVHQRVARQYRDRRVILAGDAAHLNNPLGGFGMNAALHDARNLCGKLIAILNDGADPEPLLDLYERQRKTVMQEFIQAQSIRNKRAIEMAADRAMDENERNLAAIEADPVRRRAYLMQQSMYSAVAREQEIT